LGTCKGARDVEGRTGCGGRGGEAVADGCRGQGSRRRGGVEARNRIRKGGPPRRWRKEGAGSGRGKREGRVKEGRRG